MTAPPTREFERWNGVVFRDAEKQNPGPESGASVAPKVGPVVAPKVGPVTAPTGPESGAIWEVGGGPESRSITSLTTGEAGTGPTSRGIAVDAQVLGSDLKAA